MLGRGRLTVELWRLRPLLLVMTPALARLDLLGDL